MWLLEKNGITTIVVITLKLRTLPSAKLAANDYSKQLQAKKNVTLSMVWEKKSQNKTRSIATVSEILIRTVARIKNSCVLQNAIALWLI